eukprot:jgi/Chrpa1/27368/Chrysochromulina_OHIO_Genome00025850-RA
MGVNRHPFVKDKWDERAYFLVQDVLYEGMDDGHVSGAQKEEKRPRQGEDDNMDGGPSMGWWHKNADLAKIDGLSLLAKTKEFLGKTFMIIDDDGNGVIDSKDFSNLSNLTAAMDKWDDLKWELFSNESTVDPRKFVIGITNKAFKR